MGGSLNVTMVIDHGMMKAGFQEESMAANEMAEVGGVRTIKASEFKAKCLQLMDEVAASGEEIVVTKHGRPVSRVIPYRQKSTLTFGRNRGLFEIHADIVEPMPAEWFEKDGGDEDDLF